MSIATPRINLNPILPIAGVPDALVKALNDRFREIQLTPQPSTTTAAAAPGVQVFSRTLLVKNTAVGNNIADNVTEYPGAVRVVVLVTASLRVAIVSDLTVRINAVSPSGSVVIGSFTIPAATAPATMLQFNGFTTSTLATGSVFTWDVVASDASTDPDGVGSFTVWYQ